MSREQKLIDEFKNCRGLYPYKDLCRLLGSLGFVEKSTGNGSKRKFVHSETKQVIRLHSPHPGNEVKEYAVRQVRDQLIEQGLI